jgi:hypothetical protein
VLVYLRLRLRTGWELYTSNEDGFKLDFPGAPKMTQTTFKSEYGADLPAHVYTATKGAEKYSLTVVDYREAPRLLDEKAKLTCPKDFPDEAVVRADQCGTRLLEGRHGGRGAVGDLWIPAAKRQADTPRVRLAGPGGGHELQLLNPDQSRTFAFISMHTDRLYILEGTVPRGYPPPVLFQQSMGYVDKNGNGMRYQSIYSDMYASILTVFPGQPKLTGQGRGGGAGARLPMDGNRGRDDVREYSWSLSLPQASSSRRSAQRTAPEPAPQNPR